MFKNTSDLINQINKNLDDKVYDGTSKETIDWAKNELDDMIKELQKKLDSIVDNHPLSGKEPKEL